MEGHKKSRGRKNRRIFSSKRLTSFLLALAMICTNVIADLNTAYAAGASTEVAFEMRGADLVAAVEDAIASGNVVTPDDLNFTAGKAEEFKGYLFGTGTLYEAYPDLEGGDVNAEMRVFVRLPEDADDMYAVTGDEEIIFLYVNNSDETISFRSYISYTADGEEKIKKTDRVTVRSYESTFGDEEVNVISDPVEPETPAEVPDETEPETPETDPVATESELTVSMSPNVAAFVAVPGDELATPSDLPEASAPSGDESEDPDETDGSLPADGNTDPEETTTADETTAPVDETKTPADPEELPAEGNEPVATEPEIPTAAKPNYGDLVAIGWSSTAKLYSSTLNKLHALDDVEGWEIRYSIAPEGAARIIDGPRGVEDGEDLYFGVKNQIGYTVDTVLANGEELTADTVTDNGDGSQTVWYNVPEVSEEQSIDVVMAESGEHPAFEQVITMDDGMVITIRAGEGVLPAGVTATAARVSQEVEDEVAESASEDGKAVTSVYAYDINLWLGDQLLDSEIWGGSRKVEVTFSGQIVEEESQTADSVEVMYVETVQDSDLQAKEQVALQQETFKAEDVRKVETVSNTVEVPEAEMISEISFEAEHFSIYAYVGYGIWLPFENMEMKVGDKVNVISNQLSISHEWISSDPSVVSVKDTGNHFATLSANAAGTAKITHKYYTIRGWKEESVTITVVQPKKQFKVEWYINGNLSSTDMVQEGEKPQYKNGTPTRNGVNGKATFAGWATEPNSKEYKLEADLPVVTGDTEYYAVFTYDALFYFLLEDHSNTETAATSYMYAGPDYKPVVTPGKVIVPDGFTASSRWYVPNDLNNLEAYIVAGPTDDSIRKGLAKVYEDYDSSWKYNLNWTTLSYASPSVGYDYEIIKNDTVLHVDGAITLDRDNKVGLEYSVRMPDGSTITSTRTHTKGDSVAINSTVTSTGSFVTDGYSYNAIETLDGQKYKFDGWYKDSSFSEKAGNTITVAGFASFYAKYEPAETYSVTYRFDGAIPQNVDFVLPEQNEYVPKEDVSVDTTYTADTTVTNEIGTWKFSGWTSEDVTVENGKFSMPEKSVVFTGTWELISRAKYTLQIQHIYLDKNGNREKMIIDPLSNGSVENNSLITVRARNDEGYVYAGEMHMISTASEYNPTIFTQDMLQFNMPAGTVVLKLYYDADRNHDGVADKDQIKVTYKVVNGQWNDGTTEDIEEYVTITGEWASVNLPEAGDKPDSGYEAGAWSSNVPFVFTKANDGDVYTYTYGKSPYKLTVQHVYHDENGNSTTVVDETQSRENVAEGELVRVEKRDKEDYVFGKLVFSGNGGTNSDQGTKESFLFHMYSNAVITFHYGTDKNKDQIPDMYQLTIVFEAVNGTFTETDNAKVEKTITLTDDGTAEGSWREDGKYMLTASDVPEAKPNPGYTEDSKKWDVPAPLGYTIFKEMGVDDKETDISGTQRTFTVRFDGKQKQTYTVHYIDEDTNLEIAEPQIKDTEFEAYINGNDEKIDIEGYAFTHATDLYVTDDNESNIVNVYYSKDEKGNENDPTKPDGKPDKYQVIFTYRLSDASQGTINGGTQDVYEIRSRAEEDDALAPNAAVTITPADGYRFAHWQDQNGTVYSTTEALKATSFEDDMTFTAYFETTGGEDPDNPGGEDPDNPSTPGGDDNPGGGNGSGSSNGGSGGSSSGGGSPYAPATSGPGVTIDEDAVPLAPLPDGGTSFVIDEDSVPLAPLPKTGQQPIRTQVTMLFAGIFLALASVRKRKEEN